MESNRPFVVAKNEDGSSITVHHHGAHLTSWRNKDGEELIYTSPKAIYKDGVAIRGGVPLIFPQFGGRGPLPSHGFARLRPWTLKNVENGKASFTLEVLLSDLKPSKENTPLSSNNKLCLQYNIFFSNEKLQMQIEVTNMDKTKEAEFAFAFHSYFAVENIKQTLLNGLNRTNFVDNTSGSNDLRPCEMMWGFTKEIDRLYLNQSCAVMLLDMVKQRALHISAENLPDVVVWNPWIDRTKSLKDLPSDGYKHFACVEHGAIGKKVKLSPQAVWRASQYVFVVPTSKSSSKL